MTDHDQEDRLDGIVAALRRVEERQQRERMERADADERIEGRLSQWEHRLSGFERTVNNVANNSATLLQRVVAVEAKQTSLEKAFTTAQEHTDRGIGAMMAELGKVGRRFDAQDVLVERRLTMQDQCLAAIKRDTEQTKAETLAQSPKLDRILDADAERASYEAWSRKHAEKRATQWASALWWIKFALAVFALVGAGVGALAWAMAHVR
ncbi:MAG: hypothetical protein NVS3B10_05750 [Polyangiales bacterium]